MEYQEQLAELLDGPYRQLRDDNHVTPDAVLVYAVETQTIEEVEFWQLPSRFPLAQPGQRWSYSDLGKVLEAKATLYRQSCVADELSDEDPEAEPLCGTVVITDRGGQVPLKWCRSQARIVPGQRS